MSSYKTLRTWSFALQVIGLFSVLTAIVGVVSWAVAVDGFWDTLGVICLGAPVAILLATWPIALAQMMRSLADIGDAVTPMGVASSELG
jgi:hypothetical protein